VPPECIREDDESIAQNTIRQWWVVLENDPRIVQEE
jgi:hypothetical protein